MMWFICRHIWHFVCKTKRRTLLYDHLRNHGFILTKSGWVLSSLYDVNPVAFGDELSLNVDANDNRVSADLAIKSASYYNLKEQEAIEYANEIIGIVNSNWEKIAAQYALSRSSI